MKKLILCASACLTMACSYKLVFANDNNNNNNNNIYSNATEASASVANGSAVSINEHIKAVYGQIDFNTCNKLDYEVFEKAYYGYLNLRNAGKLSNNKDILTICDFSKSSTESRLWVIDVKTKKVLINDYVAHGQGSGSEFATAFSNTSESHQSSLGFYVTGETYVGKHGTSLRMHGMDKGYNSAAYDRAVVVHGANYVSPDYVKSQHRLGRSWGCPAVSNKISDKMINTIKDGTCLFIYAPQKDYLSASVWLNNKLENVPSENAFRTIASNSSRVADTIIYKKDFAVGKY